SAKRPGVLLAVEVRLAEGLNYCAVQRRRQSGKRAVAEEECRRAVYVICSALGHDVDRGRRRSPDFRRESIDDDLEFAQAVLRKILQRAPDTVIVVVSAVTRDVAAATELARRRNLYGGGLRRVKVRRGPVARN